MFSLEKYSLTPTLRTQDLRSIKSGAVRGILTLEMLVAMTILIFCLATVVLVAFGNQSILIDSVTNAEALDIAQQLLGEERALAEQDFKLVVATTSRVTIGAMQYDRSVAVTQPDTMTKKVTVEVSYPGEFGRTQRLYLTGLFTNFKNAVGGDSCHSILTDDWTSPQIKNAVTDFSALVGDLGTYTITDVDAYKKKLYVTVEGTQTNVQENPLSASDDSAIGTVEWDNTSGVFVGSDGSRATAVLNAGQNTHYLKASNFNFSIPASATVTDIEVEIERSATGAGISDNEVKIIKADGVLGTINTQSAALWPMSDTYVSYPSSSSDSLWGEVWSPADINDSDFGVAISAKATQNRTANIDNVRVTVTYTHAFFVFDITDPESPTLIHSLGSSPIGVGFNAVHVAEGSAGSYAYVATNSTAKQFEVIDIGATPLRVLGEFSAPASGSEGTSIFYHDGFVYLGLANSPEGKEFHIIDVHNPLDALFGMVVGSYEVGGQVNAIFVRDTYAYIATAASQELLVVDVSNPSAPFAVSGFDAPHDFGNGKSMYAVGNTLYFGRTVTAGNPELYVLNAADPTLSPTSLGTAEIGDSINELLVREYLAFLLTNADVRIFNISNPASIGAPLTTLALPGGGSTFEPSMDCEGNVLYISMNDASNRGTLFVIAP